MRGTERKDHPLNERPKNRAEKPARISALSKKGRKSGRWRGVVIHGEGVREGGGGEKGLLNALGTKCRVVLDIRVDGGRGAVWRYTGEPCDFLKNLP